MFNDGTVPTSSGARRPPRPLPRGPFRRVATPGRRGSGDPPPRRGAAGRHRRRRAQPRPAPGEHVREHPDGGAPLQHPAPDRSLQLSEDRRRRGHGVEDQLGRADLHLQDPSGDQVPRRLAADLGGRQGHVRQDRVPARRHPQRPEGALHGCGARRGAGRGHGGVQAQVPLGFAARQPGLTVERDLSEEVHRPGSQLFHEERRGLGAVQAQELHARLHVRRGAQPRLLRQGPTLPGRLQVLHQHGDVRARGRHPVRAGLHRVPRPPQLRGGRHQEAAGGQGRRPGNADGGAVRLRHAEHGEAVHRRSGSPGGHARPRPLHGRQSAVPAHGASRRRWSHASGHRVGHPARRAGEDSPASGRTPRRAGPRPRSSSPRPAIPTGSRP